MPTLNGAQSRKLSEALDDAFDSVDALDEFLWEMLDQRLHNVAYGGNARTLRFKLIRAADAEGWVLRLIAAACDLRPTNVPLRELAADVGLSAAPARFEQVIMAAVPFLDVSAWRARLGELEAQVCRLEVPAPTRPAAGTGFLVGPDLVLTNYHVIDVLHKKMANPAETRLRFDYKVALDGITVNPGTIARLADDWLVAWRPPGEAPDDLDFALLRVAEPLGETPIGRAERVPGAPDRGWLRLDQAAPDGFAAGQPLLILQHPSDEPLKLALGQSDGLTATMTRLRHQVNTKPGSSGSPCLNARLEIVALHHAGDPAFPSTDAPAWNAAVPINLIRDNLAATNHLPR
jgi:hypothetical protein